MAHLLPSPKMQFFDVNGDPLSGGKVNAYEAGTSTRKATYTTAAATVANANPVILDSRGEANIFWSTGSYKIIVTDSDDVEIYTVDNITLSATGAAGASFRVGTGAPSDSLGSDGDRYLRNGTGQIYLKDAGVYSVEATISLPATTIVNTPAGNLAAVTVQAALDELQTDVDTRLSALTGAVTASGGGSQAATITDEAVTNAKLAHAAAWTIKIRNAGTTGDPSDAALADITEEVSPADADFLLGFIATGEIRKFDIGNLPAGSGGGGGSLRWVEGANSPVLTYENGLDVYEFEPGLAQELYTVIRVPTSYVAAGPINLRVLWTCASTSNDALLLAQSTLIRAEVDEITSTTNQRTTTNAAITMSASNDLEPQKIVLDISSSIGEINGVAITAGDLIKVRVYESSSTVANVIKLIPDCSEVTFI